MGSPVLHPTFEQRQIFESGITQEVEVRKLSSLVGETGNSVSEKAFLISNAIRLAASTVEKSAEREEQFVSKTQTNIRNVNTEFNSYAQDVRSSQDFVGT